MPRERKKTKTVRLPAETADLAYKISGAMGYKDISDFLDPILRPILEKLRAKAANSLLKPDDED